MASGFEAISLVQLGAEILGADLVEHGVDVFEAELLGARLADLRAVLADRVVLEQAGQLLGVGQVGLDEVDQGGRLVGEPGDVEQIGPDVLQVVGRGIDDEHDVLAR